MWNICATFLSPNYGIPSKLNFKAAEPSRFLSGGSLRLEATWWHDKNKFFIGLGLPWCVFDFYSSITASKVTALNVSSRKIFLTLLPSVLGIKYIFPVSFSLLSPVFIESIFCTYLMHLMKTSRSVLTVVSISPMTHRRYLCFIWGFYCWVCYQLILNLPVEVSSLCQSAQVIHGRYIEKKQKKDDYYIADKSQFISNRRKGKIEANKVVASNGWLNKLVGLLIVDCVITSLL